MIKKIYLLPLFLLVLSFVACNETEEYDKYANWQERNEAFIDSLQTVYNSSQRGNLERIQDPRDKSSYIFFKRMENSNSDVPFPLYTSEVTVFYRGMYINEDVFSNAEAPNYFVTKLYADGEIDLFDQNFKGDDPSVDFDSPSTGLVKDFISGWIEVLQIMRPGDRFEVYIPYTSAYGENGQTDVYGSITVKGYSTLVFDVRLERIDEY